jgi:dCMP deaminase
MADLFEDWEKPEWDDYFMGIALVASTRSIDPSAKHGCVIVDDKKRILSIGYNGPPRGCLDGNIPLTRPKKYLFMEHAEKNAIINRQLSIEDSILQSGVRRVVYGPFKSRGISDEDDVAIKLMLRGRKSFSMEEFRGDMLECLRMGIDYYTKKLDGEQGE